VKKTLMSDTLRSSFLGIMKKGAWKQGSSPKKLPMYELTFAPIPPKAGIPLPLYPPLHFMERG
jgi:hypothetical protein